MATHAQLQERYSAFVSIVARRLELIGPNPADVLVIVPECFELAGVTIPGQPVMFAMYVETALRNEDSIELLAERFVGGWLRQVSIDAVRYQSSHTYNAYSAYSAGGQALSGDVVQAGYRDR
jgi:hypothetical protein